MRAAKPNELKTHALPILTARISEGELSKWFPVVFQHIDDPQEAAEPSKAALIKLDAGDYFVLYYGEISNQLTLRIPESTALPPSYLLFFTKCRFRARAFCGAARMRDCRGTSRRTASPPRARVVRRETKFTTETQRTRSFSVFSVSPW